MPKPAEEAEVLGGPTLHVILSVVATAMCWGREVTDGIKRRLDNK